MFENTHLPMKCLPSDLLWEYRIEVVFMERPCIMLTFLTRMVCRGVSSFVTGCPCCVWDREFTTCPVCGDVLWHSPERNFAVSAQATGLHNAFGNRTAISPRNQCVKHNSAKGIWLYDRCCGIVLYIGNDCLHIQWPIPFNQFYSVLDK